MKVKVLISFSDKENKVVQPAGKIVELSEERYEEIMASNENLIEAAEGEPQEFPKHVGGGYYELSNGEKVKGKADAVLAQAVIDVN